jgi:hypothetical protein
MINDFDGAAEEVVKQSKKMWKRKWYDIETKYL